MSQILLDVPDDSLLALRTSAEDGGPELFLAVAMKLYEMQCRSSGAAAQLAGLPRVVFLQRLAEFGVDAFRLTEDQLPREVRFA